MQGAKERRSHSHSDQWYGVGEVFLEEVDDFVACGDLLELIKGHEEGTGKGLVLK